MSVTPIPTPKKPPHKPAVVRLYEILESDPWGTQHYRYDEFTRNLEILWGGWVPVIDEHYQRIVRFAGERHRTTLSREGLIHAVADLCRANAYDSLQDYLNGLAWDGTRRLETFLSDAFGCVQDKYSALVGAKFIESLVARGLRPGCKMDYCPIFYSRQGREKSKALAALGGQWFSDTLPLKLTGRDIIYALQGAWLIEAAELQSFTQAETETLKAFISRQVDRTDMKYRNTVETFPRRCVIAGTTNTFSMLKDPTGGRRFWPVECGEINVEYVTENRDQLFAEAVRRHKDGIQWWPDQSHTAMLEEQQAAHYQADFREEVILEFVESRTGYTTTADILSHCLQIPEDRQNRRLENEVGAVMSQLEYVSRQRRVLGTQKRVWVKQGAPS